MTGTLSKTTDVDEAEVIASEVFYEARIEPARNSRLPFRFELAHNTVGPMTFCIWNFGCEVNVRASGPDVTYTVGIPILGSIPIRVEQESVMAGPSTAVIVSPYKGLSYRSFQTGTERVFALVLDQTSLEDHLRTLLGRDHIRTINFAPALNIHTGLGAQWSRIAKTLIFDLQSPTGLMTNPLIAPQLADSIMTGLLLAADHPYREELHGGTRTVAPPAIRKAAEIIESRAHEPLTVAGIADEVGYSIRALQAGYRKHLNMTPREHLHRIRLERAHAMLKYADPTYATVGEIAVKWGFHQSGYFASEYRKVYGVSPHITLRDG